MRPSVLNPALNTATALPEIIRRLGLDSYGAMGGALKGGMTPGYSPIERGGAYEDPFPAFTPPELPMDGGFPQAQARIDPRAALLKRRTDAMAGMRSAIEQPPVAQPTPRMGIQDPKRAAIIAAIALISQAFNKGGEFGQGLIGGFTQGQELLGQQDYAKQVAEANAQSQKQKVQQALAEMMLQESNMNLADYDRQEQIDYGRREDARKEFLGEQARREQLKLQQDQIDYAKLKQLEQDKRMEQDDLRAEATNFNTRYANARNSTANWDDAAESVWAKQREQLKERGIPGEWLSPVAPAGSMTNAVAGREQRNEQFDWTKGIRQEYLNIAKERANRAETQVPAAIKAKRMAIAKADERINAARKEREILFEVGPTQGEDEAVFASALQAAIASELWEVNQKRKLYGKPPLKPEDYAAQLYPWMANIAKSAAGSIGMKGSIGRPPGNTPLSVAGLNVRPDAGASAGSGVSNPAKRDLALKTIEGFYAKGREAKPGDRFYDPSYVLAKVREVKEAYKKETGQELR